VHPLRIGISACLLGEKVRFDAGHKRDDFLVGTLAPFVEWVPVCPELESGLGVPRESMRLVQSGTGIRLLTVRTKRDETVRLQRYAARRVEQLAGAGLSGFVLKRDSPSCGLERVKVYGHAIPEKTGRGLFAEALVARFPSLPIEEEGRLNDARLRENFIERIFAYLPRHRAVQGTMDDRPARRLPHRAQADADGALAERLSASRASRRRQRHAFAARAR
jgi:uncharacterized protein YbbK (DUF523 family)